MRLETCVESWVAQNPRPQLSTWAPQVFWPKTIKTILLIIINRILLVSWGSKVGDFASISEIATHEWGTWGRHVNRAPHWLSYFYVLLKASEPSNIGCLSCGRRERATKSKCQIGTVSPISRSMSNKYLGRKCFTISKPYNDHKHWMATTTSIKLHQPRGVTFFWHLGAEDNINGFNIKALPHWIMALNMARGLLRGIGSTGSYSRRVYTDFGFLFFFPILYYVLKWGTCNVGQEKIITCETPNQSISNDVR